MKVHLVLLAAGLRGLRMLYLVTDKRRRQEAEPVISRGSLHVHIASRREGRRRGIYFLCKLCILAKVTTKIPNFILKTGQSLMFADLNKTVQILPSHNSAVGLNRSGLIKVMKEHQAYLEQQWGKKQTKGFSLFM